MSEILLGTCGWSYAEWEGILYPQKEAKLKQYSSIFPTVEIDSTFYSLPKREIVLGWARNTPSNFIFSAKLPQTITHKKLLDPAREIETDLNQFLEAMEDLTDTGKLGCILAQLPPFFKLDNERLESFLRILPRTLSFAVEFRHHSWLRDETFKLLEKYGVAYTIVDEPLLPPDAHVTSDVAYIRWHGRGSKPWFNYRYSTEQLQEWTPKINETAGRAKKVLGYFNNHFHGYAPENCLQTMQMLGITTTHSQAALQRVSFYREGKPTAKGLETWTGPIIDRSVEKIILAFADEETIGLARSVPKKDFSLREESKRILAAYIEDTTVEINFQQCTIVHRCPAWAESSRHQKFCPHVLKLFLSINPERAKSALALIRSNLNNWKFESRVAVEFPR
ncbi:MAG: DUF72 domain-containing protein [Candidatus Bathyarchaeia archaeon]